MRMAPSCCGSFVQAERSVLLIEHWKPEVPIGARPLLKAFIELWAPLAPQSLFKLNNIDTHFWYDEAGGHTVRLNAVARRRRA